ncbi:hypothetical protein Krac_5170 [Ktedonobacter racemifer DSM 44963]|uniref:Uncharacterized protein n=1 Tax=Ktedonobacter racemifer DSM 44963 TaxID=485913 RepID=D6TV50_KTERA|nr:hypothetical protein Krac_5170 [Ktedonobacter racemifer DSM 44963]
MAHADVVKLLNEGVMLVGSLRLPTSITPSFRSERRRRER